MMFTPSAVRRWTVVAAVSLALGSVPASCGGDSTTDAPTTAPAPAVTAEPLDSAEPTTPSEPTSTVEATTPSEPTAAVEPTSTVEAVDTTLVNVYWGWTVQNPAVDGPERIGAGAREVSADDPVRAGVEALFAGVDDVEREIGMVSNIPEGSEVLGITVDGSTATIDVSAEFEQPGGTLGESMRLAQVVFTLTQFDEVDRVRFEVDGDPRDAVLSHGFEVGDGLTRDDFADVRATIMVEDPFPGAEVEDPLVIRGESNTFEATVRYAITTAGGEGVVVTEGFTTATGGNGTWGTFEIEVDLDDVASDDASGPGAIVLWEDDPETGERVDIVEIPIVLPTG